MGNRLTIYVKSDGDMWEIVWRRSNRCGSTMWLSRDSEACRDATHALALQFRPLETVNRSGALVKQQGHLGAPGRTMNIHGIQNQTLTLTKL